MPTLSDKIYAAIINVPEDELKTFVTPETTIGVYLSNTTWLAKNNNKTYPFVT